MNAKAVLGLLLLLGGAVFGGKMTSVPIESTLLAQSETQPTSKRILGAVVTVSESETDIQFLTRVDTGAMTCSIHTVEKQVLDGSKYMEENIGKTIRFKLDNRSGHTQWVERKIAEVRKIRTSEGEETRYLVPMKLSVEGVEQEVLVSLNDRSQMTYTLLLGRNFLAGQFIVDVTGADEQPRLLASGG